MAVRRDRTPIGTLMVRKGLLTEAQLREALDRQREAGGKLGETCVRLGFLTEDQMLDVVEGQIGVPRVRLGGYLVEPEALGLVPASVARRHLVVPLFRIENTLTVAMADPLNVYAIDELHQITSLDVDPALSSRGEIDEAIRQYYGSGGTIRDVISEASRAHAASGRAEDLSPEAMAQDAPVIRLVNLLLSQAVAESASDVHVEPCAADVRVRFRVDGVLHEQSSLPQHMAAAVASRIKIMANLDIAERRIPQDGRLQLSVAGRSVDMRVSTYPTIFGEKIVVRVLDKERMAIGLEQVGLEPDTLSAFEEVIVRPTGIVLITGPTGSGKTTTLYGVLRRIATIEKNVMTIEDPIEYFLDIVNQSQMNLRAGLTFATGLRSILRQDPDVIMVGEIRDLETAEVAAMTRRLRSPSTLHSPATLFFRRCTQTTPRERSHAWWTWASSPFLWRLRSSPCSRSAWPARSAASAPHCTRLRRRRLRAWDPLPRSFHAKRFAAARAAPCASTPATRDAPGCSSCSGWIPRSRIS